MTGRLDPQAGAAAAAEAVARRSYGRLVAYLSAATRDLTAAEDALSEAFAAALGSWPARGVPDHPEAWLLTVARRCAIDARRRRQSHAAAERSLVLLAEESAAVDAGALPDKRLGLMFACAHPAIDPAVHAPLMLQVILGFDAATIASAFLVRPAAMSQRLVRAKRRIHQAGIPFTLPGREEFGARLDAVLEAIYATFAEGWLDPAGTETRRRNLAGEGIWLGRLVASLLPAAPEPLGLLALMLFAEARRTARRSPSGDYVPLAEQDTALWNADMIEEAESLLRHASASRALGRYQIEAAIQSAHVTRRLTSLTDWPAIVLLYDALQAIANSPVVAINRAVAVAGAFGAAAGLRELEQVAGDRRLADYQPYWAARAGLLSELGEVPAADETYERAIGLEQDEAVRRFLQQRRDALLR